MEFSCFNGVMNCDYCGSCHSEFEERASKEKRQAKEQGYQQGREDERKRILGMVDWKQQEDGIRRKLVIEIDYSDVLNGEQVASIICEKLKELGNE